MVRSQFLGKGVTMVQAGVRTLNLSVEKNAMNTVKKLMLIVATLALGALWVPFASAGCANPSGKPHVSPQSWDGEADFASNFMLTSGHDDDVSIVGMWHVLFIAEGNVGPGLPPDGVVVQDALSHWHSDGTEFTLSNRVPQTGDVCLGVWEKVGELRYKVNHFGIAFDPATDPNNPLGYARIRQDIVLNPDGKTFKGRFTIQQYDSSGNLLIEIKGALKGTRVNLNTSVSDLLNQS